MSKVENRPIAVLLENLEVETGASEFHGLMTGYLCAKTSSSAGERVELYREWLELDVCGQELKTIDELYLHTEESLGEYSDFEFRILLPDDDSSISQRSKALSQWCTGFLSGFGSAGRFSQADLGEDVAEAFIDLSKIAGLAQEVSQGVPESEDNEVDLMEICEYVRISVLVIFTECGGAKSNH